MDSEERMEQFLKSPYNADGDFIGPLIEAFSAEFEEIQQALGDIEDSKFVDSAEPAQLERLATIFDVEREAGEEVAAFRARLKVGLQSQITSATVGEVQQIAATILDTGIENLEVREPSSEDAFFQIAIDTNEVDVPVSPAVLSEIINEVSAAGVNVGINIFVGEGGTMILTGSPVETTTINDEGLSSENLGTLSSGEWTLSRE